MRNIETIEVGGKKVEIKIIKPGIKTKKDMLAHFREIHFVYYPTVFEPTYRKLLKGPVKDEERWNHIGMTTKQILKLEDKYMFDRAEQIAGNMTLKNDILAAGNDFNPFPRLETITVGANGDELWEQRERKLAGPADFAGQMMRQTFGQSKTMLLAILSVSQPKHVCLHTKYGLSSPPTDAMFKPRSPNKLEFYNVHVSEMPAEFEAYEQHWPLIICGTVNRWHYRFPYTRYDLAQSVEALMWSLESLALQLNATYKHFQERQPFEGGDAIDLADTELEIWGFGNCDHWAHRIRAKRSASANITDRMAYEQCVDEEEEILESVEKEFDALLCEAWKGKVSFMLNDHVQPCEGCGDLDGSDGNWLR